VQRLLVLVHDPYHLDADEARAWLREEVLAVLSRDGAQRATLTRLGEGPPRASGGFGWLLEFGVVPGRSPHAAVRELIADLRLLGMSPLVAVADDRHAIDLAAR
jgi:hypothetical protein